MPTADDYRYAALRFEEIAIDVAQGSVAAARSWDQVTAGGSWGRRIRSTVTAAQTELSEMVERLMSMSDECRSRAKVCDEYAAEIASYRKHPDLFDSFPQTPYDWVEVDGRPASDRTKLGGIW